MLNQSQESLEEEQSLRSTEHANNQPQKQSSNHYLSKQSSQNYSNISPSNKILSPKCQYLLCFILLLLITAAYLLINNYQIQQNEISDILKAINKTRLKKHIEQQKMSLRSNQKPLWIFPEENVPITYKWFLRRINYVARRNAKKAGYKVLQITKSNWRQFVSEQTNQKLSTVIQSLSIYNKQQQKLLPQITPQLINKIVRQLIILEILYWRGGIYVDQKAILTDSLTWLESIENHTEINAGQRMRPAVVAFYSPQYSSLPSKQAIETQEQAEKYIVRYPSITPYFIYANDTSLFLQDLLSEYYNLINNPESAEDLIANYSINIPSLQGKHPLLQALTLSSQLTLRKKQIQLTQINQNTSQSTLAIDYYNLITINENFGPNKINFILGQKSPESIYIRLSQMTLIQLEQQFGHLHFFTLLKPLNTIIDLFEPNFQQNKILEGSFIDEYLLDESFTSSTYTLKYSRYAVDITKWELFPKKVWTYLETIEHQNSLLMQLWLEHIKQKTFSSGFTFNVITQKNIQKYISSDAISKINEAIKNTKNNITDKTRSELISLAVLSQTGGIWIDPFMILHQNINWALETYKDFKIWNRLELLPSVLLNFNPREGGVFNWTYNSTCNNTKQAWNLGFYNNFMASEPQANLTIRWLQQYLKNLQIPYNELQIKFIKVGIKQYQRTSSNNQTLLMLDTLKYILAQKQQELQKNYIQMTSVGYYGLWSMNAFMGELKFTEYTNFMDATGQNSFFWRYSQEYVENAIGKIYYPFKIYNTELLEDLLQNNYNNLSTIIHSKSLFMKTLFKSQPNIIQKNGVLKLQKLIGQQQRWSVFPRQIWIYHSQTNDGTLMNQCIKNIQHYANLSKFQVKLISGGTYHQFFPNKLAKQIDTFLELLQKRKKNDNSLNNNYQSIKERLILLYLLRQHGGIIINKRILLLEGLEWLNDLDNNPLINRGIEALPEIFGFFSPGYSSLNQLKDDRHLVKFPSLDTNFLAAVKNSSFIIDLLQQFKNVLSEPTIARQHITDMLDQPKWLHGYDIYEQCFFLACHFTLKSKQKEMEALHINIHAIDHYGIYSLSSSLYVDKLPNLFDQKTSLFNVKQHLSEMSVDQLETRVGPLHYLTLIPKFWDIQSFIQKQTKNENYGSIIKRSFIHTFILLNNSEKGVSQNQEQIQMNNNTTEWNDLPKNVWYYEPKGIGQARLIKQMLVTNINSIATKEGFILRQINDENIESLISSQDFLKISRLLQFSWSQIHKPYLYSLAVLLQHGGILLPSNYLILQGFSWLKNIAKLQKTFIYNRFGLLPKVFLFFNINGQSNNQWTYNTQFKTKVSKLLNYSPEIIAAEKQSQFIKDWLNKFITQIKLDQSPHQLSDCHPEQTKLYKQNRALLVSDVLFCTIYRKQQTLKGSPTNTITEANHYYKLWSMSQPQQIDQLTTRLNLDQHPDNLSSLLWQYPYQTIKPVLSNPTGLLHLSNQTLNKLQKKIKEWGNSAWGLPTSITHELQSHIKQQLPPSPVQGTTIL